MMTLLSLALLTTSADVVRKPFGTTKSGEAVDRYTIRNSRGSTAAILTYGATVNSLRVADRNGKVENVVLAFDTLAAYEGPAASSYMGSIAGRYANRIAGGRFKLDGKTYKLPTNNGPNSLHGGTRGFDRRVWKATSRNGKGGPSVRLTLQDPAGSNGYPGTVNTTVTYTLTESNALRIEYRATTTRATPINLTHHSYFNLKDGGKTDVKGHVLQIDADRYTPVNAVQIPTGRLAPVAGTPIDFRRAKPIGRDLGSMGANPAGYDHNLVLRPRRGLARAATVAEPTTGRRMEMWTTEPGVQFYTANFLKGDMTGGNGAVFAQYHGFCLEAQHFPDSPNRPSFPNTILRPGQTYRQTTEYRFSVSR